LNSNNLIKYFISVFYTSCYQLISQYRRTLERCEQVHIKKD